MKMITNAVTTYFALKSILFSVLMIFILSVLLYFPQQTYACPAGYTCSGECNNVGDCPTSGRTCELVIVGEHYMIQDSGDPCGGGIGQAIMGGVIPPNTATRVWFPKSQIRLLDFLSLLLRIFTIVCGLWFMFNIIVGGYMFITSSGDSAVAGKFKDSFYFSLIGLALVAAAYLIAALVGSIFFGDSGFIIRPALFSATQL